MENRGNRYHRIAVLLDVKQRERADVANLVLFGSVLSNKSNDVVGARGHGKEQDEWCHNHSDNLGQKDDNLVLKQARELTTHLQQ